MCLSKLSWHGRNDNYGIYDLFLQLLPPHHVVCEFPSRNGAGWLLLRNRSHFDFGPSHSAVRAIGPVLVHERAQLKALVSGSFTLHFFVWSPHINTSAYHVCVCIFSPCLPWQGGAKGGPGARWDKGGGWWHSVGPPISQEALWAPETWASPC